MGGLDSPAYWNWPGVHPDIFTTADPLAMIRKVSRLMMFRLVPEVMRGTHGKFEPVTLGTCKKVSLVADRPLYIHADGEVYTSFGSNLRRLTVEIMPGALNVVRGK